MVLLQSGITKTQERQQKQRCDRFAAGTAEAIGAAQQCLFSLLPYHERSRQAASWYTACAQGMLRCNYAPLDAWIKEQACLANAEHFELRDLLQLLRICRRSAIEIDGWDEDVFSAVDEVINEGIFAIRAEVSWEIPAGLNYLKEAERKSAIAPELNALESAANSEVREGERRVSGRNRLALPIRLRHNTEFGQREEITNTQNVSQTGLYFKTQAAFQLQSRLQIIYPFWTDPGSINKEYTAEVARIDRLPDQSWGVAVEFLQNLRDKTS
jgi:PilZ domain